MENQNNNPGDALVQTPVVPAVSKTKSKAASAPVESTYSAAELVRVARSRFGVPPEVVSAALRLAGKDCATESELRQLVAQLMKREVV